MVSVLQFADLKEAKPFSRGQFFPTPQIAHENSKGNLMLLARIGH